VIAPDLEYLCSLNEIHKLAVARLLEGENGMPMELAELCEDIGNLYLNLSDRLRALTLPAPRRG